ASDGNSAVAVREGVAQALGPQNPLGYTAEQLLQASPDFLFKPEISATDYGIAGVFVRFLIDRHGISAFRQFFRATAEPSEQMEPVVRAAFQSSFGESLDQVWPIFVASD